MPIFGNHLCAGRSHQHGDEITYHGTKGFFTFFPKFSAQIRDFQRRNKAENIHRLKISLSTSALSNSKIIKIKNK